MKAEVVKVVYEEACICWRCPRCGAVQEDVIRSGMFYDVECLKCGWRGVVRIRYEIAEA